MEDLKKSAADADLIPARSLTGALDAITRVNEGEVRATGWLADPGGDVTPKATFFCMPFVSPNAAVTFWRSPEVCPIATDFPSTKAMVVRD